MIILSRYPVAELRTCQPHTDHSADKLVRCMHWRDSSGAWHCETLYPYTVEAPQDVAPAIPPSADAAAPSTVEQRDAAHAVGGGSPNPELRRYVVTGPYQPISNTCPARHELAYTAADALVQAFGGKGQSVRPWIEKLHGAWEGGEP